jgi:hypothetical protein
MKPHGLLVFDADRHHDGEDGVAHFRALCAEHEPLPPHPIVLTANGGEHHIFKQPANKIGNHKLGNGLETRGYRHGNSGGYIIAAGSRLSDGRCWRLASGSPSLLNATLPELPSWLAEYARERREEQRQPEPDRRAGKREEAYATKALDNLARDLAAMPRESGRNNQLNIAGLKLGSMVARGWIGRATVEGRLFDACVANRLVKDTGTNAVRGTIRSGLEAGLKERHDDLKERDNSKGNGAANPGAARTSEQGSKRLVVHRASEITPVAVDWLWPGRIAIGKTTLVGGDPGLGKSQLAAFIAAIISISGQWPCQEGRAPKRSVMVLCAEDGMADTIVPRLMAAQADREKITIITAVTETDGSGRRVFNLSKDLDVLEGLIAGIGDVGLVIIDPVDAYLGAGAGGIDSHKNAAVRAVLEPLSELADRLRTAVLAVTHFSKQAGGKAMYRFIGSIAHIGSARVAFAVVADAENEGRVLLLHAKNNLAPPQKGLAFRLEQHLVADGVIGSTVVFESEHVTVTADEALAADGDVETRSAKEDVKNFLADILAQGPQPVSKIEEEAKAAGLLGGQQDIGQSKPFPAGAVGALDQAPPSKGREGGGLGMGTPGDLSDALGVSDALKREGT